MATRIRSIDITTHARKRAMTRMAGLIEESLGPSPSHELIGVYLRAFVMEAASKGVSVPHPLDQTLHIDYLKMSLVLRVWPSGHARLITITPTTFQEDRFDAHRRKSGGRNKGRRGRLDRQRKRTEHEEDSWTS